MNVSSEILRLLILGLILNNFCYSSILLEKSVLRNSIQRPSHDQLIRVKRRGYSSGSGAMPLLLGVAAGAVLASLVKKILGKGVIAGANGQDFPIITTITGNPQDAG